VTPNHNPDPIPDRPEWREELDEAYEAYFSGEISEEELEDRVEDALRKRPDDGFTSGIDLQPLSSEDTDGVGYGEGEFPP